MIEAVSIDWTGVKISAKADISIYGGNNNKDCAPGVSSSNASASAGLASFVVVPRKLEWPRANEGRINAISS